MSDRYTQSELNAFARKDRMIVAQTSLERAIEYKPNADIQTVLEIADKFYDYVFRRADGVSNTDSNMVDSTERVNKETVIPVPTKKQGEWLNKITEKYGFTNEEVFTKYGKYPQSKEEAIECVRVLKGN
jgi:hypothetical protein